LTRRDAGLGDGERCGDSEEVLGSTIEPTTPRPMSQPARNAGPLVRARGVVSMRTTAMMGIGLMATPAAIARV
jgi:hypothetical protein